MRNAVIIKKSQGDTPEVRFFRSAQDAKSEFKKTELGEGDSLELWTSGQGRIKRKRNKGGAVAVETESDPFIPEQIETEVTDDKPKGRKARKNQE